MNDAEKKAEAARRTAIDDEGKHEDLVSEGFYKVPPPAGMPKSPPKIQWGDKFRKWPVTKRLKYALDLASSMNHAAKLLTIERDKILTAARLQERALKTAQENVAAVNLLMQQTLKDFNAEKQDLLKGLEARQTEIVELRKLLEASKV